MEITIASIVCARCRYIDKKINFYHFDGSFIKKIKGFSLIELLIESFLGTLLLFGLVKLHSRFRSCMRWKANLVKLQEEGQFSSYLLTQRIQEAGNIGVSRKDLLGSKIQFKVTIRNIYLIFSKEKLLLTLI
ncbi:hypothetical protein B1F79_01465 [Coxiella-like endosymbiont of Rhipicephalus sanguineus]|uniref:hypothetical protein n=1 Tax=Coxiella-like endosymbiont of Rhipicephalus sanguineus TaxID=1955402 RepID=UPI00203A46A4|nr:hypothetical protein [Coxiella-like endosymbiont of Rhipicephalus sanguineus]MBT8506357.1 hypothetical protein [Coxiella-like endosymbiont of Rhipicephalus sanguineus]